MTVTIGRRELLVALGGTAAAWPIAARAQQPEQMRRVVVLMSTGEDDPQDATRLAAFERGLQELGWVIGRNLNIRLSLGCWRSRQLTQIRNRIARTCA